MGFGLTISKMIVSQLHGEISVESEQNKGSTFTFDIKIDDFYDSNLEESKDSEQIYQKYDNGTLVNRVQSDQLSMGSEMTFYPLRKNEERKPKRTPIKSKFSKKSLGNFE